MIRLNSLGAQVAYLGGPWRKLTRGEWSGNRWKIAGRILAVLGRAIQNSVFPRHTTELPVAQSQGIDAQTQASRKLTIPDVLGLDERTARTLLRDAGLDGRVVQIVPQHEASVAGFVTSQQPDSGTAVKEGETPPGIRLALSAQAAMPAVVGLPRDSRCSVPAGNGSSCQPASSPDINYKGKPVTEYEVDLVAVFRKCA